MTDIISREDAIKADFLKNIKNHQMTILHDDGVYRHVKFADPQSSNRWFEIVTWPRHLSYSGDMGSFTFSRVEDMFKFFHTESDVPFLNEHYWKEKIEAVDKNSSLEVFCKETHNQWVIDMVDDWASCCESDVLPSGHTVDEVKYKLLEELCSVEDEAQMFETVNSLDIDGFDDEISLDGYHPNVTPYRILWCMLAINWLIKVYYKSKGEQYARLPL